MPDHLDVIIVDIEAVLCMPPYALILLLIVWNRRKSQETTFHNHYYTLVISQGIADFAAIFIFFPVTCARAFKVGNRFIYSLGDYGAARFLATGAAYLLITRGIGVALITIQRFITLCKSHSWVERTVKNLPPGVIILAHWTLPFLIYSPAIVLSDSYFEDESTLFIVSTDQFQSVSPLCVVVAFFSCTLLTVVLYSIIITFLCSAKHIAENSRKSHLKRKNEYRLCAHVLILTFVAILIFIYWLLELAFSSEGKKDSLRELRSHYPVISGNFTFINPVVYIVWNRDIQRMLRNLVLKKRTSTVTASGGVGGTGGNQIFSDHIAIGGNLNHHRNAHSC